MEFGAFTLIIDSSINPSEVGRAVEERGFDSFWLGEHSHIPVNFTSPWPGGRKIPYEYPRAVDPFVAFGAIAAVTSRIRIGTGICLVPARDPIVLAKQVATIDQISQGRFIFGIGGGWNLEEIGNHGTDPALRWKVMGERVAAMKEIWTQVEAEYHGHFVDFDPIWSWPKPVQKPHPPIHIAGEGIHTLRRVAEYGDGWLPILARGKEPFPDSVARLNRMGAELGRGPFPVSIFGAPTDPDEIRRLAEQGATGFIFRLSSPDDQDVMYRELDELAEVVRAVRAGG